MQENKDKNIELFQILLKKLVCQKYKYDENILKQKLLKILIIG